MNSKLNIMQQERDPLNLGSLPLVEPPTDDWPAIETALRSQQGRRRLWKVAGGALAVAASIAVAATLVLNPAAISPVKPWGKPWGRPKSRQIPKLQVKKLWLR